MAGIRVNSGTKRIEVNDEGECILLPLGDDGFVSRFYKLLDKAKKEAEEIRLSEDDILGGMDRVIAFNEKLKNEVDALFGAETCRKVFGDITPGIDLFMDFFNQIVPFFEEHNRERISKMNKYGAGRTGSV